MHCWIAAAALVALVLAGAAHAATDIDCDPSTAPAGRVPSQRLICESALFSMGYQRIYADQQRLLKAGTITEAEVAAFRKKRDSCETAACLDAVFREWRTFAAQAGSKR
ncbi:hypothetical protein [Cupriavidus oxalaticus]|jgi:hypothetical protein|uniref:Secreted protein n=1 Tax=Cupriavidus oxalaticus TaxID=96344 RepID=A0A5P3VLU5_9BURK|nr:hypothetical protein [Cupriavidus oxalaticus]QEZ46905.1 hypothetical protein D2917_22255 [Cupriavidus oxalaticus]